MQNFIWLLNYLLQMLSYKCVKDNRLSEIIKVRLTTHFIMSHISLSIIGRFGHVRLDVEDIGLQCFLPVGQLDIQQNNQFKCNIRVRVRSILVHITTLHWQSHCHAIVMYVWWYFSHKPGLQSVRSEQIESKTWRWESMKEKV